MNAKESFFPEMQGEKQLKLCLNCSRCDFGLNERELKLLDEAFNLRHSLETMRHWLEKKNIKLPGGSGVDDPLKAQVVEIILNRRVFCPATKVSVNIMEQTCFLFLQRLEKSSGQDPDAPMPRP